MKINEGLKKALKIISALGTIIGIIFIILKVLRIINWYWLIVLSPIFIWWVIPSVVGIFIGIIKIIQFRKEESKIANNQIDQTLDKLNNEIDASLEKHRERSNMLGVPK